MSGAGAVLQAARVRFKPRAAAVFGAGYTFGSTLGEGLSILRHDNSKMPLSKASGIVSGMKTTFEDQLLLIRVFIRPDIYKILIDEYDENVISEYICKKLYELL